MARAKRALRRSPRYIAQRGIASLRRRAQLPIAAITPRLVTERTLLRESGAEDIDALWSRLLQQPFFVTPANREMWARAFQSHYPEAAGALLSKADSVLRHEFDLLGSGTVALGDALPWSTDFKTGRQWPPQYCGHIEYSELDRSTDVKVPWELSRCQHFTSLGQAYWLTGDNRYAEEFVSQTSDWIRTNPYAWTVNWACAMDVALRAASWIWGFYFMADAPACRSRAFRVEFLRALYLHGEFVANHLERGALNGNHYLCDGTGLVFLGCFFSATARGRRWRETGRDIVVSELFAQVTPDGVDFEQSTSYHRLVLEAFSTSYLLLERSGVEIPADAWARLERMHEYVAAYTKPNGRTPLVGDADDGRVQILGTQPLNDHRYLLSTGAVKFANASLKSGAASFWDESFWLLGPAGLDDFEALPPGTIETRSQAFPDGGVFVLRHDGSHVMIDCAEVGMRGVGGHGHNDALSFELFLNGFNVITDCGAYLYTASREWRNRFRSTAFHNTVQVDDEELNRFVSADALWQLHYDAVPFGATLRHGAEVDSFSGGHRGYARLANPVVHRRELFLSKRAPRLLVRDWLDTTGRHAYTWRFHLDPEVAVDVHGGDVRLAAEAGEVWLLPSVAAGTQMTLQPGWVSPSYGVKVPTTVVTWTLNAAGDVHASFLFAEARLTAGDRADAAVQLSRAS